MEKTITLNESQMKLLQEYKEAELIERAGMRRSAQAAKDKRDMGSFEAACKAYDKAALRLDVAARIFAASVAAVV
jgi:hypothetical protein